LFIYECDNYRTILKEALLEKKASIGTAFTFQNMAKACRVQKTYLSKVLNDRGHLNGDQLYLACDYLGFNGEERDFIFLIFEQERTVVQKRKTELQTQISSLKKRHARTEAHLESKILPTGSENFQEYYLDPNLQIIHMFLTIDRFARNTALIGEKLHLRADILADALRKLQRLGIVEMRESKFQVVLDNIHLPKGSDLYPPYRSLLRAKANGWVDRLPADKSYNFSAIFSTTPRTKQKIHMAFLDFLKSAQEMAGKTKSEEVYQMNFDLFGWSD